MKLIMNKKTNIDNQLRSENLPDFASLAQQEEIFADLQTLWDEQNRRIDNLLAAHPEASPVRLNLRSRRTRRHHIMNEYLILALLNVAGGIYTLFVLLPDPYILLRIIGIVLASTNAVLAAQSLYYYFVFRHHHPARVSLAHMSSFTRRMHMKPHYAPHPDKSRKPRRQRVYDTKPAMKTFDSTFSVFNFPQVVVASIVAIVVLTTVSCSPVSDGHVLSDANLASRSFAVEYTDSLISKI